MDIDAASLFTGFLVGLMVFQVRGAKRILEALGFLGMLLFMLTLINVFISKNLNATHTYNIVISFFVGNTLGHFVYLVGANISRYIQFGELSPRMLIYLMTTLLMLIAFKALFG